MPESQLQESDMNDDQRNARAVVLAERWWPERYVGDLSVAQWKRVYRALDESEADDAS